MADYYDALIGATEMEARLRREYTQQFESEWTENPPEMPIKKTVWDYGAAIALRAISSIATVLLTASATFLVFMKMEEASLVASDYGSYAWIAGLIVAICAITSLDLYQFLRGMELSKKPEEELPKSMRKIIEVTPILIMACMISAAAYRPISMFDFLGFVKPIMEGLIIAMVGIVPVFLVEPSGYMFGKAVDRPDDENAKALSQYRTELRDYNKRKSDALAAYLNERVKSNEDLMRNAMRASRHKQKHDVAQAEVEIVQQTGTGITDAIKMYIASEYNGNPYAVSDYAVVAEKIGYGSDVKVVNKIRAIVSRLRDTYLLDNLKANGITRDNVSAQYVESLLTDFGAQIVTVDDSKLLKIKSAL